MEIKYTHIRLPAALAARLRAAAECYCVGLELRREEWVGDTTSNNARGAGRISLAAFITVLLDQRERRAARRLEYARRKRAKSRRPKSLPLPSAQQLRGAANVEGECGSQK